MTQYIDIDAFDDDDLDNKDEGGDRIVEKPMSMGQLDMELAKLMNKGGSQTNSNNGMTAMELTMALCNDLLEQSMDEDNDLLAATEEVKTAAFSTPQFLAGNTAAESSAFEDGDFEEYDEYETQEVADHDLHDLLAIPNTETGAEEEDANVVKWDGEGLFQVDVDQEVKLTAKQEKYLKCYQTMYDDQQLNTELLLEVLHYIIKTSHGEGAILVFLPGWQEISEVSMMLENTVPFSNRSRYMVLPLHSGIPSQDQRKVLRRPPPGSRKIVLRYVFSLVEKKSCKIRVAWAIHSSLTLLVYVQWFQIIVQT